MIKREMAGSRVIMLEVAGFIKKSDAFLNLSGLSQIYVLDTNEKPRRWP
jgi:hypothetical protein